MIGNLIVRQAFKINQNPCLDFTRFFLAKAFNQPYMSVLIYFAVIASILTMTQWNDVGRNSAGAIWMRQWNPVIASGLVKQAVQRATTYSAAVIEIVQSILPVIIGEIHWKVVFNRPAPMFRNFFKNYPVWQLSPLTLIFTEFVGFLSTSLAMVFRRLLNMREIPAFRTSFITFGVAKIFSFFSLPNQVRVIKAKLSLVSENAILTQRRKPILRTFISIKFPGRFIFPTSTTALFRVPIWFDWILCNSFSIFLMAIFTVTLKSIIIARIRGEMTCRQFLVTLGAFLGGVHIGFLRDLCLINNVGSLQRFGVHAVNYSALAHIKYYTAIGGYNHAI